MFTAYPENTALRVEEVKKSIMINNTCLFTQLLFAWKKSVPFHAGTIACLQSGAGGVLVSNHLVLHLIAEIVTQYSYGRDTFYRKAPREEYNAQKSWRRRNLAQVILVSPLHGKSTV